MAAPPFETGAVKDTVACALPGTAETPVGAPGAVAFETVTEIGEDVAVLPARSRATAKSVCEPSETLVVFHVVVVIWGEVEEVVRISAPI
jgi:hypothetical protein